MSVLGEGRVSIQSIPTLPAGRGLRFLKEPGVVLIACASTRGYHRDFHLLSTVKWSLVYLGVVCHHDADICVSRKCDVKGVSVLLKVSMLI